MIRATLKAICLSLAMNSAMTSGVLAKSDSLRSPSTAPKAAKSNSAKSTGTQVYESESSQLTFTDTVRVVRDLDGTTEVLFVKKSGVFTAPDDGAALEKLIMSQKSGSSVTVVADESSSKIIGVSPAQERSSTKTEAGKPKSGK